MDHSALTDAEVWLFGSHARGDADPGSDVDVLLISALSDPPVPRLAYPPGELSVSCYTWAEFDHMVGYGSLFLHHVRDEGRPLFPMTGGRLLAGLLQLGPYQRVEYELRSFRQVVEDVEESLKGESSPAFELAVLGAALRHSAILGSYLLDRLAFGRSSAIEGVLPRLGLGAAAVNEAKTIYAFRLHAERGLEAPYQPTVGDVRRGAHLTKAIIDRLEEIKR